MNEQRIIKTHIAAQSAIEELQELQRCWKKGAGASKTWEHLIRAEKHLKRVRNNLEIHINDLYNCQIS